MLYLRKRYFFKRRQWQVDRQLKHEAIATEYFDRNVTLLLWNTEDGHGSSVCQELDRHIREVATAENIELEHVILLSYANYISLISIPLNIQTSMAATMLWTFMKNSKSIGLVQMPQFVYRNGSLWAAEKTVMELILQGNANADIQFSIPFVDQTDPRDKRPMAFPGRIVTSSLVDMRDGPISSSPLLQHRRTGPVKQLAGNDMHDMSK